MNYRLILAAAALAVSPSIAFAQASTATGAVGGAAAGAAVGGPVGAIVGGTVGAAVGSAAEPPAEVHTYVMRERVPSVAVEERVVVGAPLPGKVRIRTIPQHDDYAFAVVNNKRVLVEPKTRKIIRIYE